ncbi:hypothetical protein HZS_7828 [Henneguya salminicola]|nr:hypothetical protein HZS_7828 [Henneguya salminicola]
MRFRFPEDIDPAIEGWITPQMLCWTTGYIPGILILRLPLNQGQHNSLCIIIKGFNSGTNFYDPYVYTLLTGNPLILLLRPIT